MCFRIWTVLGLALVLAACSNDKNNGSKEDGGLGESDAGNEDAAGPEEDAAAADAGPDEDAAVGKLPLPRLERPPRGGLPDSLRPPR
jgi:hypothetical protein